MSVFFTSDPHFGHKKIADLRGFNDTEEHDSYLADAWSRHVRKDDVVWVLGDLCMGRPEYALNMLRPLPGRKRLVFGNHDMGHPMHRDAHKWLAAYLEVFEYAAPFARASVAGKKVLLSHFPYSGDHTAEERHTQWRLRDLGEPLLHGHTHSPFRWDIPAKSVHVGVDAWSLRPVRDDEVAEYLPL